MTRLRQILNVFGFAGFIRLCRERGIRRSQNAKAIWRRRMNLPNALTVSRIFLTFLFVILLNVRGFFPKFLACLVFLIASFTDYFDGYFAKKYHLISNFGKFMDPVADKFLILAAFFIFMKMNIIPSWMFAVIFIREAVITLFRFWVFRKGEVLTAEVFGKLKTVSQIIAISVILMLILFGESHLPHDIVAIIVPILVSTIHAAMWVVVVLTLFSGVSYLWSNRRFLYDA